MVPNFKFKVSGGGIGEEKNATLAEGVPFTIGRQGTGLQLLDTSISRNHFALLLENGKIFAIDTGSTNGTFVQGEKITRRELANGNVIQFGVYTLELIQLPVAHLTKETPKVSQPKAESKPRPELRVSTKNTASEIDFSFEGLKQLHLDVVKDPKSFFENTNFRGDVTKSIQIIAICFLATHTLSILPISYSALSSNTGPSIFTQLALGSFLMIGVSLVLSIAQAVSFAYGLDYFREFVGSEGRFEQYLRYFAYGSIFGVTAQIISTMTLGIAGPLVFVALLIGTIYGFFQVFAPKPWPFIGFALGFGLVWATITNIVFRILGPMLYMPSYL